MRYRFFTSWLIESPRDDVWEVLQDTLRWPEWWRGVVRVSEIDAGDDGRVGSRYRVAWRSRIPYELVFDFTVRELEAPLRMQGSATGGLEGTGCWQLFEQGGLTVVTYQWDVATTKRWMKLVGPLARPLFEYNHDVVMRWGGEGLARRLRAPLLAAG